MNVERFFEHHQIRENPFGAEEARHDPIFDRLIDAPANHPDFAKIMGDRAQPGTAVVFGEKGCGKTAIRLLIGQKIVEHNRDEDREGGGTLIVAYDDLNPVLDRFMKHTRKHRGAKSLNDERINRYLGDFRLADHQDAILSLAVTQVIDNLLGDLSMSPADGKLAGEREMVLAITKPKQLKRLPRRARVNLAVLAALYDQPADGNVVGRWSRLRRRLRLGWRLPIALPKLAAIIGAIATVGLVIAHLILGKEDAPVWLRPAVAGAGAVTVIGAALWTWQACTRWWLCRKVRRDMPTVSRGEGELRAMVKNLRRRDLAHQPWPVAAAGSDARYDLTRRLLDVLQCLGYRSIVVLIDRVDEPTLVAGRPERMRAIVWPMFDNKFLQQQAVGLKLLLPVELRYLLLRESADFFQEARLDKQNLIDRLTWSGATLFDLCSARLRACSAINEDARESSMHLTDLFEEDVTRQDLIDALDQMQQPRDAFKFLYAVVQEHCRTVSADQAAFRIPRLTLEAIRRQQAQRVRELHQGLSPA